MISQGLFYCVDGYSTDVSYQPKCVTQTIKYCMIVEDDKCIEC